MGLAWSAAQAQRPQKTQMEDAKMKSSTRDKAEGTLKDLKGKAKEAVGTQSGDPQLRDEGRLDRAEGKVQKKVGDVKKVFNR